MATLLSSLKLVAATRENKTSPVLQRRQKLIKKIDEQMDTIACETNILIESVSAVRFVSNFEGLA